MMHRDNKKNIHLYIIYVNDYYLIIKINKKISFILMSIQKKSTLKGDDYMIL